MIIQPPSSSFEFGPSDKLPMFDFTKAEFPKGLAFYDFDHGTKTARLALHILSSAYPELDKQHEQSVLWTAAHFHDAARTEPFGREDPDHPLRGAALLDRFLRDHDHYCHDVKLREEACRLVARHHEEPDEPLGRVLADADAYEAARVLPGMSEGLRYLKSRTEKLHTEWARERVNLKRYMGHRGWR